MSRLAAVWKWFTLERTVNLLGAGIILAIVLPIVTYVFSYWLVDVSCSQVREGATRRSVERRLFYMSSQIIARDAIPYGMVPPMGEPQVFFVEYSRLIDSFVVGYDGKTSTVVYVLPTYE